MENIENSEDKKDMENDPSTNNQDSKKEKTSLKGLLIDMVEVVGTALILTFILLIFIQPSIVEGRSMYPTLHDTDKLILWKLGDVKQGDIVVFDSHDAQNAKYVKRIIGVAGDHVVISNSTIIVNDVILDEPYINEPNFNGSVDLIIPENSIYVLGDNRNNSNDSRIFGSVLLDDVDGKMVFNLDKTMRNLFGNEN